MTGDVTRDMTGETHRCERCEQMIPQEAREEHEDWHFAKDLQAQEEPGAATSQPPPQAVDPSSMVDSKQNGNGNTEEPPMYAPPPNPPPNAQNAASFAPPETAPPTRSRASARNHTNQVIEAAKSRARDEQQMQNALQNLQFQYNIYNSEIEPEHDTDYYCNCPIHNYQRMKWSRYGVQKMWSQAVMYPGKSSTSLT